MTITNTQATELSLDQLDDISAGFLGAALKTAQMSFKLAARHGVRSGFKPSNIKQYYTFINRAPAHSQKLIANFDAAPTTLQYIGLGAKLAVSAAGIGIGVAAIAKNAGSIKNSAQSIFGSIFG